MRIFQKNTKKNGGVIRTKLHAETHRDYTKCLFHLYEVFVPQKD